MPTPIKMDQNDDAVETDLFFGADPDEEVDENEEIDFGNELEDENASDKDDSDSDSDDDSDEDDSGESEDKGDEDDSDEDDDSGSKDDSDPDEDDDETEDDSDDEDDDDEPAPQAKEQRIPKQRFDEVNERMKSAEAKLLQQETDKAAADLAAVDAFDFDGKEREYMELVVDSEFDKAQAVRREIRAAEQAQSQAFTTQQAESNREQTKIELSFADVVKDLEADYPTMQPGAKGFKQELVDEVLTLHEGFVNKGMTADNAIAKAVKYVAKMNDIVALSEQGEADEGEETPAPKAKGSKKKESKEEIRKKVKAKTRQPGKMPKGEEEPATDLDSMSEDEFAALPESKKKEMRGDYL